MKIAKFIRQNFKAAGKNFINLLIILAIFLGMAQVALIGNINEVSADSLYDSQIGLEDEIGKKAFGQGSEPTDIRIVVARIINVFLQFIAIVFLGLIIFSGFKWMTSGGNSENVEQAKKQLGRAFIGLLIVISSWTIANFIMNCLMDIAGDSMFKKYCP